MNNHLFTADMTDWDETISETDRMVICDAQTSGGLLIALPRGEAVRLHDMLLSRGVDSAIIGSFTEKGMGRIRIKRKE